MAQTCNKLVVTSLQAQKHNLQVHSSIYRSEAQLLIGSAINRSEMLGLHSDSHSLFNGIGFVFPEGLQHAHS